MSGNSRKSILKRKIPAGYTVATIIVFIGIFFGVIHFSDSAYRTKIQARIPRVIIEEENAVEKTKKLFSVSSVPSPKGLSFDKKGEEVWTTLLLNEKRGVVVFNADDGNKVEDISLDGGGGVEIVFSENGEKAYASQMETARVFEIDTTTKKIERIFHTESVWSKVLALSPEERYLYVSNWVGNDVSVIDLKTGETEKRFATVKEPRGLYVTKDGKSLYVAGFKNGEIEKIDLTTGEKEVLFTSGGAMRHIVGDEEKKVLYVSDMGTNTIWKVSLEEREAEKFAETDSNPNTIALSPDKKVLYVSCRGKNRADGNYYMPGPERGSILFFNTKNGNILDAIVAGNQPTALDISPGGNLLVFSNFLDGSLEFYEIPGFEKLKEKGSEERDLKKKL